MRTSAFGRYSDKFLRGQRYVGGTQAAPIGTVMSGTFTAMDAKTNKIVWQHKTPYRLGGGGGSSVTAGGLVFRGEPDGNFLALDAKTGEELWRFQTGFGADAPPVIYEVDGEQFVAIATGGNQLQGSAYGDAVWVFSLKGQLGPLWPPPPPSTVAGPTGPIATGVDTVKMGSINVEYSFVPSRVRIKAGTSLTFTNVGDLPHNAVAWEKRDWDTGLLPSGGTTKVTFDKPGVYYYICHAASVDVWAGHRRVVSHHGGGFTAGVGLTARPSAGRARALPAALVVAACLVQCDGGWAAAAEPSRPPRERCSR